MSAIELSKEEVVMFIENDEKIVNALRLIQDAHPDCKFWAVPMFIGDHFVNVFCKYDGVTFEELCGLVKSIFPTMEDEADSEPEISLMLYEGIPELTQKHLYDISEVLR